MSPPPKRFSVVHSRTTDGRRAKSRSMDIRRHIVRRASFSLSRSNCFHTLRTSWTWKFSSKTRRLLAKDRVPARSGRGFRRVASARRVRPIGGRGDRQQLADRLDPVRLPMSVDEGDHCFVRRSYSAAAK
jgi:hypothetical protein